MTHTTRLVIGIVFLISVIQFSPLYASHTPDPTSVTVAGSLQSELGCPDDWQPGCASTYLTFDPEDDVWHATFNIPAGSWEYKAALNNSWDENYGANATLNGANIGLNLADAKSVRFYYSHSTHWIADNVTKTIAVAPGNFQSELGCSGDWDPSCLRSWLQDPDGDGIYSFSTKGLPAGNYEAKVAINESWDVNYGQGGVQNGDNIPFTVPSDCAETVFTYDPGTHILTIGPGGPAPQPSSVTIAGSLQSELGCTGDWMPDCSNTHLSFEATDGVWQNAFDIPAGNWEYKAPLNDSWDENYGQNATPNGPNIQLNLANARNVKFYYSHSTHWVADNFNKVIAVAAGSFQSELGCPGDWQPDCLRSWVQDPDGDGIYTFSARLPAGDYEAKVAINETWDENYGLGGVPNGPNIPFSVPVSCTEIFFTYDAVTHILTIGAEGGPHGNLNKAQAHWVLEDAIVWNLAGFQPDWTVQLHHDPNGDLALGEDGVSGGTAIPLVYDPAGLDPDTLAKFPHLAGYKVFRIPPEHLAEVPDAVKDQLAVSALDGTELIDATSLQIPGVLDDLYTYNGSLGITFNGSSPTLRVWAPSARNLKLHLFPNSTSPEEAILPMTVDPNTGVWSITGNSGWKNKYFTYEVEVFVRLTGNVETNLVTDPYSLSLSRNSTRSQIVNLNDAALKPSGWSGFQKPQLKAPEDIVLYELHVRDFSAYDPSVPDNLRGTFKAFTVANSFGMKHLSALAVAGLTHIHLLPSFDIATINEDKSQWQFPGDLSVYPPDSDQQQAAIAAIANQDPFNWGYDPWHYTVPEGSYSTNPDGSARILEYRQMVKALNESGLRVVMDVVYNHTNSSGQNEKSVLDRIVPGYYHRYNADGNIERSTCCENTASEHNMMEKLMVDSVITWAKQYKVDGFRFDLMGHHMKRNMLKIREALNALTPQQDGVDGKKVYLYGEAWNFGEVADGARGENAIQRNMAGTGIGSFNDRIRDGARGGGPFSGIQEQGYLTGLYYDPNATNQGSAQDQLNTLLQRTDWIRTGLAGELANYQFVDRFGNLVHARDIDYNGQQSGYTADPQEIINYIEAHDNDTLFDAIQLKAPVSTAMAQRVRIQNLGMSLVLLGQGVPFLHAGVDLLRSKSLDRNSYNSGDWFNKLDFTYMSNNWGVGLPPEQDNGANWPIFQPLLADASLDPQHADILDAVQHLREMLQIRKSSPLFRLQTEQQVIDHLHFLNTGPSQIPGLIVMSLQDDAGAIDPKHKLVVVLINANDEPVSFAEAKFTSVPLHLHPVQQASADPVVQSSSFDALTGTFNIPGRTAAVFVTDKK
jgi:pullulanase